MDTIFYNGIIHTLDKAYPEVSALAIKDGVILRLGSDEERLYFLLENMKDVPEEQRTARFVSVITMLIPGHAPLVARGECEGIITHAPAGDGGFGYDPIFYSPEEGMTFSQISSQRKNQISHRARALFRLEELLRQEGFHADK